IWLMHPDRQLISPMELLHVSAFKPHQLTQKFIVQNAAGTQVQFQQRAPWFDESPATLVTGGVPAGQSARLYRLFEFLGTRNRAAGMDAITLNAGNAVNAPGPQVVNVPTSGLTPSGAYWNIKAGDTLVVDY